MSLSLAIVFAAPLAVGSALAPPPPPGEAESRRVLPVSVVDKEGKPLLGLAAADFRGKFRGKPVEVLSAAVDTSPRDIAVVLDTSASTAPTWNFAWDAAEDMIRKLASRNRFAIFTQADTLGQLSELSGDSKVLRQALAKGRAQRPAGPSALFNGLVLLGKGHRWAGFGNVIYLITDGEDTASMATREDAQIAVARAGVRIFVVLSHRRETRSARVVYSAAEDSMRRLAEATGGHVLPLEISRNARDADRELRSFYSLMCDVYRLEVAFPETIDKEREWTLAVADVNGKTRKDVRLAYPRSLYPSQ